MNLLIQSALKKRNNLPYVEIPELSKIRWLRHAFLTRQGGVSSPPYDSLNLSEKDGDLEENVFKNMRTVAKALGLDPSRTVLLDQRHRDGILILKEPVIPLPSPLEYDAVITNSLNLFLGILTADCLPILVVDKKRKVIAAIHAGRQGTALHITAKVLRKMEEEFGCLSKDLVIALGSSIGPCCYEIDEKAFQPGWEPFSTPRGGGKWMVDLGQINVAQMKREGIKEEQISWTNLCTHCRNDLFFSYRKEGRTGRQLSFIGITE